MPNPQNSSFSTAIPLQRDDEGHALNADKTSGGDNGGDAKEGDEVRFGEELYATGEDEDRHVQHGHGYVDADKDADKTNADADAQTGEENQATATDKYNAANNREQEHSGFNHQTQSLDKGSLTPYDKGYDAEQARPTPSPYAGHERDGYMPEAGYLKAKPTKGKEPTIGRSSRSGADAAGSSKSLS